LRQDPDIIMVGEIRDQETAEISIHSALTGHLVFSTLHTNTACGAVTRLIDMGVESFLVESSLIGVLAQRLVRKICPKCKEKYKPKKELLKELGLMKLEGKEIYHGKGCKHCDNSGYKGRVGLFELLLVDEQVKDLILSKSSSEKIEEHACSKQGMITMWEDGIGKILSGMTTIDEVARVIQETQL
jgi:general secretion pathway protein E